MRITAAVSVSIVIAGLLAGCQTAPAHIVVDSGSPTLATLSREPDVWMEAELAGTLIDADGCFGLDTDGYIATVVFPVGTERTDGGVDIPDYGEIALGEELAGFGGGEISATDSDLTVPIECVTESGYVTFMNPFDGP